MSNGPRQIYNTPTSILRPDESQERGGLLNTPLKEYIFPFLKENIFTLPEPDPRYEKGVQYPSLITTAEDRERLSRISNQEQGLDEALMAQGMPTISGYPSPYEQKPMPSTAEDAQEQYGLEDTGVVSPEDFIQNAYSQYGEPETAFPTPKMTEEEKEATKSRFAGLLDIFDNKEALGKIALGVALLEGTPMTEAFEMYENFAGAGSALEIEVYDKQTGQIVGQGAKNNAQLRQLVEQDPNRYRLQPFGTQASYDYDNEQMRLSRYDDANKQARDDLYFPALSTSQTAIADGEKLLQIVNDPNFESGVIEDLSLGTRQLLNQLGITEDLSVMSQVQFETIVSRLIPNVRPEGAGATSNFEIELYARALPSLRNSKEENRKLLEDLLKGARINQARANYVIDATSEIGDVSASEFAYEFNQLVNRAENSLNDNVAMEISDEEKRRLGNIYNFVSREQLSKMDAKTTLPSNTIITL